MEKSLDRKEELMKRSKKSFESIFREDRPSINVFSELMMRTINAINSEVALKGAEDIVKILEEIERHHANLLKPDLVESDRKSILDNLAEIKKGAFKSFLSRTFEGTDEENEALSSMMGYFSVAVGDIIRLHRQKRDLI